MAEKKATTKKPQYKVEMEILGAVYKGQGATIETALAKIPLTWERVKGKGMLRVSYGKSKYELLMSRPNLTRICSNKISRTMWAKRLKLLLESK